MRTSLIEKLVWVYVYGGLILLGLGLAAQRNDSTLGWVIAGIGAAAILVGIVLVWVRSRMNESK